MASVPLPLLCDEIPLTGLKQTLVELRKCNVGSWRRTTLLLFTSLLLLLLWDQILLFRHAFIRQPGWTCPIRYAIISISCSGAFEIVFVKLKVTANVNLAEKVNPTIKSQMYALAWLIG